MKAKKIIPVLLVLVFVTIMLTACQDKESKEIAIDEYTDQVLGVTYSIYKLENQSEETFYAKVTSVLPNANYPDIVSITIPATIVYKDIEYSVTTIGDLAFYKSDYDIIYLSQGITTIEKFAFSKAKATRIDLPTTIKSIGEYAFLNCTSLRDVYLYAIIPPELGEHAFSVVDAKTSKYVSSEILNIRVPSTALKRYNNIIEYPQWEMYQGNIR
ncbi:MAG: leucine-rich repeat domain-containing protein [Clostridiales bacterium]|nr:leucine-rich repeat domain-containing protein [Clostridiales bacterium]